MKKNQKKKKGLAKLPMYNIIFPSCLSETTGQELIKMMNWQRWQFKICSTSGEIKKQKERYKDCCDYFSPSFFAFGVSGIFFGLLISGTS